MDGRCVACGADGLRLVEEITAAAIAAAWRREDVALGQRDVADERHASLMRVLPPLIRFHECPACGIEIASPRQVWPAADYPPDQSYPIRWEFHRAADDLGPRPLDVLELGCGTGEFLALAGARGHRAVGVDFSAHAVASAQARGLSAFHGSLDDLRPHLAPGQRFDAIVFFQVIEHLPDVTPLFETIAAWARPDARVFIACPGPRRFSRLIAEQSAGRSDFWDYPPHHVLRWTLPALDAALRRHGWTTEIALEEPLYWTGAASRIGIARATHRGRLQSPIGRRLTIAGAWASLAVAPQSRRFGDSLYVCARRSGADAA